MKFFIDTADLEEIREALSWGVLSGVTTNPSLYAKTGGKLADFEGHMVKICEMCEGLPVSAESQAKTCEGMVADGRRLAKREKDLDLGALRASGVRPERVISTLACAAGLAEPGWEGRPAELVSGFSWNRLAAHRHDIVVDDVFLARLRA